MIAHRVNDSQQRWPMSGNGHGGWAGDIKTFLAVYESLPLTPPMQAGITDRVWGIKELLCV